MVWNTIAHPKMMVIDVDTSYGPIYFANTTKLAFYDLVVSSTVSNMSAKYVLVKGDFETLKRMLLNGEAVKGLISTKVVRKVTNGSPKTVTTSSKNFEFDVSYVFNADDGTERITFNDDHNVTLQLLKDNTLVV